MSAWAKLYKAEIFKNIRYRQGIIHEDEEIIHKILNKCESAVYINYKLYNLLWAYIK